jgi:hypothetical protein
MSILEAGGNAVDAAVATAFAVSVVEPFASGIGGGGVALVATIDGALDSYDYREVVAQDGVIPASEVGIPGYVMGMEALHEGYGELAWDALLAPAIELAEEATTSDILADQLREYSWKRINTVLLRAIHQYTGVAYEADILWNSVVVQMALSILWTICALVVMNFSRRMQERKLWILGACLLGLVVLKLALKDLHGAGTLAGIISFMAVGALMLLIGYLSPIPAKAKSAKEESWQ